MEKKASYAKPANSGARISMGECSECKAEWFMFESEKKWWETEGIAEGLIIPKRCEACRALKRQRNGEKYSLAQNIRKIANKIANKEHVGKEEEVVVSLRDVADKLEKKYKPQTVTS